MIEEAILGDWLEVGEEPEAAVDLEAEAEGKALLPSALIHILLLKLGATSTKVTSVH